MFNGSASRKRFFLYSGASLLMLLLFVSEVQGRMNPRFDYLAISASPDGRQIAYQTPAYNKSGDILTEVHICGLDGKGDKVIAKVPGAWDLHWADGGHIAATAFGATEIHVITLKNGQDRKVMIGDDYDWSVPEVMAGGKWAVFPAVKKTPTRKYELFALNLSTDELKVLDPDVTIQSYVSSSPDGRFVAYGVGSYQRDYPLRITDVQTGKTTDLKKNGVGVSWSPDGKWIAYTGNILQGGSWYGGVPCDGSILKTNLATGETVTLTGTPINVYDEKGEEWEMSGDISPKWSPDGKLIAYRHIHKKTAKGNKNLIGDDFLMVMSPDGSGQRKLLDKYKSMAWSRDGKSIFVRDDKFVSRIDVGTGTSRKIASWAIPERPERKESDYKHMQAPGASITYYGIDQKYAKALLAVASASRDIYENVYHSDMPKTVELNVVKDSMGGTSLWNDGQSQIFLTVESEDKLLPPKRSGVFNIYGICHEMGHMTMYRHINMIGLPNGVGEAWGDYAGSVVTDEVYKRLGERVWPEPYDYREDGMKRFRANETNQDLLNDEQSFRVAAKFLVANDKYGAEKVFAAMNEAVKGDVYGKDVMPRFVDALAKSTGDPAAKEIFPKEMISPEMRWQVADRNITDSTVEGLSAVEDSSGLTLKYDDGKSDGKRSTAGSGHAVVFKRPAGNWAVDAVEMYGSRYGTKEPPKENFQIFICDGDFNVIKEIDEPYSKLTYDEKWYRFDFEPVSVPEGFYVCIFFNPTATKGFYMNYDSDVKKSHSKSALPWTFISDLNDKWDWMIRAHLTKKS